MKKISLLLLAATSIPLSGTSGEKTPDEIAEDYLAEYTHTRENLFAGEPGHIPEDLDHEPYTECKVFRQTYQWEPINRSKAKLWQCEGKWPGGSFPAIVQIWDADGSLSSVYELEFPLIAQVTKAWAFDLDPIRFVLNVECLLRHHPDEKTVFAFHFDPKRVRDVHWSSNGKETDRGGELIPGGPVVSREELEQSGKMLVPTLYSPPIEERLKATGSGQ